MDEPPLIGLPGRPWRANAPAGPTFLPARSSLPIRKPPDTIVPEAFFFKFGRDDETAANANDGLDRHALAFISARWLKNNACEMVARRAVGSNGLVMRNVGSGRIPVSSRSG